MKRIFLVSLASILLISCSAVRVGYSQLDWLIPALFESYVSLDAAQKIQLRRHTEELIAWHCRSELTGYAAWLRDVNRDFQKGITRDQLLMHVEQLDQAWLALAEQAIPRVADMFSMLNDEQVKELLINMDESNDGYRKEYLDQSETALQRELAKSMVKSFDRWLGRLTPEQKEMITQWSVRVRLMQQERWANRLAWQKEFRSLLANRQDKKAMTAGLRRLVIEWGSRVPDSYRKHYEHNEVLVLQLIVDMGSSMTEVQKQYMERKATRYADDFDALACRTPVNRVATSAGFTVRSGNRQVVLVRG